MSFISVFPLETDEQRQDFREHVLLVLEDHTCIPRHHLEPFVEIFDDGRATAALGGTCYHGDGRISLPSGKVVKSVPGDDESLGSVFGLGGGEIGGHFHLRFSGCYCPDCGGLRFDDYKEGVSD